MPAGTTTVCPVHFAPETVVPPSHENASRPVVVEECPTKTVSGPSSDPRTKKETDRGRSPPSGGETTAPPADENRTTPSPL